MRARAAAWLAAIALVVGLSAPASAAPALDVRVASTVVTTTSGVSNVVANVGTCSGTSKWIQKNVWTYNTYGMWLTKISLKTTWFYNGSRVTCSYSQRSAAVSTYGNAGGWDWKGWQDWSEGFYAYNGRTNGGVRTVTSGHFRLCYNLIARTICPSDAYSTARTYVHYNGTYTKSGGTAS